MRDNPKRMIAVTGRISVHDLGPVIRDGKNTPGKPNVVLSGVYHDLAGLHIWAGI